MAACVCFGWCNARQVTMFFAGLPPGKSTNNNHWGRVVGARYRSAQVDLNKLDLSRFGVFMLSRTAQHGDFADAPHFDRHCSLLTEPWCGTDICKPWSAHRHKNLTINTRTKLQPNAFAPWPWSQAQRAQYGLKQTNAHVLYGRNDLRRQPPQFKYKLDLTEPTSVLLWRSNNNESAIQPFPDHTWVEVYRTQTTAKWYEKSGVAEGVNYGCWFYPLHPPYSRGTGTFINTGRSLVLRHRTEASRFFRRTAMLKGSCQDDERRACVHAKGGRLLCTDRCWAARAHAAGYDTVQLLSGADYMPELIVTTQSCLSQRTPIRTCPPVPLRTGEDATRECKCSESSAVLNCLDTPIR